MRILTNEECLLIAGGFSSSDSGGSDTYLIENYYDASMPEPAPGPAPTTLDQDPFFQSLGAHFATNDDADALAELFASASYSVGDVATVVHGADQGSGTGRGGLGDDFMFALNMYSAFNGFNDYRTPDTNVMAALDNAGVGYSITSQGSIYAPGYGYAVADGSDFTAASTINNGSFYSDADTGATSAVLVIGNSAHNTLVDVPTFGDNAIVVNAQYAGPALKGGGELLKDIFAGMVGGEIDRWLHQDPNDPARIQVREHLRQAEVRVAGMFDPSRGVVEKSVPMRDATIASGFIQDHKFFVDMNGNGLPDIAFTQNPTTSQWYINYGDGWRPHDNPFTAPVF